MLTLWRHRQHSVWCTDFATGSGAMAKLPGRQFGIDLVLQLSLWASQA
ncbi:hypothetical protein C4K31_0806 [Pseudomonas chlororaphis subsp. piscium]|nr:hypothetical protein C4K31_0806 [Pseudomonas chlororaphis subsp. piscium]